MADGYTGEKMYRLLKKLKAVKSTLKDLNKNGFSEIQALVL